MCDDSYDLVPLYSLKNVKNTQGEVLLLAKLLKVFPPDMFLVFFKLYKWYQIIKKCLIFIDFLLVSFLNFELYVSIGSAKSNHSRFCRFI